MSTSILIHPSRAFKNPKHPSMAIEIRLVHSPAQGSQLIHSASSQNEPVKTGWTGDMCTARYGDRLCANLGAEKWGKSRTKSVICERR